MVLKQCTKIILDDGEAHDLDDDKKDEIEKTRVLKSFADKCYRTMLIAYKDYDEGEWEEFKAEHGYFETLEQQYQVESDLTVVAIFALQDPLRPGIAETTDILHRAGINIRMVTGDFIDTAVAISKEAHIITDQDKFQEGYDENYACITGETFRNAISGRVFVNSEGKVECEIQHMGKFRQIMASLKVLARSEPNDKFLLVHGLIEEGKTVAVTGDGTNDAPALSRADVGFAMGISGTEVAINSADIKLLDDNFCSIKTAVTFGRNIYDNVKKFLQFQLTVNVVAMFIVFSGSILFEETPLNAVQMLWVNLIMDTLASLALATEPPHPEVLLRKPSHRDDKIVDSVMWRNIMGHAIY
jgi:Ca2+ transporting ATPase